MHNYADEARAFHFFSNPLASIVLCTFASSLIKAPLKGGSAVIDDLHASIALWFLPGVGTRIYGLEYFP